MKTFVLKNKFKKIVCRLIIEENDLFLYTPDGNYCVGAIKTRVGTSTLHFIFFRQDPNVHLWYYANKDLSDRFCCGLVYDGQHCIPTTKKTKAAFLKALKNISVINII